jgi:hypothetical protein
MNISQPFIIARLQHRCSFTIAQTIRLSTPEPFNDAIIAYRNGAAQSGFVTSARRSPVYSTSL